MDTKKEQALLDMNKLFLEALRHREQEIIRYLVIIGPALGGFVWMLSRYYDHPQNFGPEALAIGSVGLILLLLLGAWYCMALGYNYRSVVLQLTKTEDALDVSSVVLKAWPGSPEDVIKSTKLGSVRFVRVILRLKENSFCYNLPFMLPPEVICVFWVACVAGIGYLTISTCLALDSGCSAKLVARVGIVCLVIAFLGSPACYGIKLRRLCEKEKAPQRTSSNGDAEYPQGPRINRSTNSSTNSTP